jgi:hypothetical protein
VPDRTALLETVREGRRRLAGTGPGFVRSNGDFARVSVPQQDCDVLRDLLVDARARVVIEIGLGYGSSAFIADAAFVDGSHVFHRVFVDLAFLDELVRPGGLIVLDDCQWPSVATAVRYFELNCGWQPVVVRPSTRLRGFRIPAPRAEPTFEAFTPFHNV